MELKETLDRLMEIRIEVSDLEGLNVEWYKDLNEWKNCPWSWVLPLQPYKIRDSIPTLKASILDLSDKASLKRFRDAGSKPTYHHISLERLKHFMDTGRYTHVFVEGIGELDQLQVGELDAWLRSKLDTYND